MTTHHCASCGLEMTRKVGRTGPFLRCLQGCTIVDANEKGAPIRDSAWDGARVRERVERAKDDLISLIQNRVPSRADRLAYIGMVLDAESLTMLGALRHYIQQTLTDDRAEPDTTSGDGTPRSGDPSPS